MYLAFTGHARLSMNNSSSRSPTKFETINIVKMMGLTLKSTFSSVSLGLLFCCSEGEDARFALRGTSTKHRSSSAWVWATSSLLKESFCPPFPDAAFWSSPIGCSLWSGLLRRLFTIFWFSSVISFWHNGSPLLEEVLRALDSTVEYLCGSSPRGTLLIFAMI